MLSPEDAAELADLHRRAFGRGLTPLDETAIRRLQELERAQAGSPETEPAEVETPELSATVEHEAPDAEIPTPKRTRSGTRLALMGSGLLVGGILIGLPLSIPETSPLPTPSPTATPVATALARPDADDWDAGSITYLGSYLSADLWIATERAGASTCMIEMGRFSDNKSPFTLCAPTTSYEVNG